MPDLNQDGVIDESERSAYPVPDEPGFLPSAAEARQIPALLGLVPQEPAQLAPAVYESPVDLGLTPPSAAPAEVEFEQAPAPEPIPLAPVPETLPAPETTGIERASGELLNLGGRLDTLAGQSERLSERFAVLRERYDDATTDADRAALVARMQPIASALENVQLEQSQARDKAARLADQGQVELLAEQTRLQGEIQGAAQQEIEATRRKAEAERVGAEERTQIARARLEEDRAAYRRALEAEPKMRTGAVISEMLAESINAAVEKRQPRFGPIIARGRQDARDVYRDRAERALALVEFGDDEVARRAAVSAEIDAQQAAAEVEIMTRAEQSLAQQLAQAAAPLEQARLGLQLDSLRQEREAREAQAEQARIDANLKRDKAQSEVELTRAKIAGERADVAKTEAETAKLRRRGGSGARAATGANVVTPSDLAARGLSKEQVKEVRETGIRWGGNFVFNPDGSAVLARDASTAREGEKRIQAGQEVFERANRILALRKEYGFGDWASLSNDQKKRLQSLGADLKTSYNSAKALGSLDEGTVAIVEQVIGDPAALFDQTPRLREFMSLVQADTDKYMRNAFGYQGPQLQFPRIVDAPALDPARLQTQIAAPIAEGKGRSLESRKADVKTLRNALKADPDLSLEEADERYAATLDDASDRLRADVLEAQDRLKALRAPEYAQAQAELGRAIIENARVNFKPGATGEEKRAAERAMRKAEANVRKLESKEERALAAKIDDHEELLEHIRQEAADARGKLGRARRGREREEKRKRVEGERAVEAFEAGQAPSGARGF